LRSVFSFYLNSSMCFSLFSSWIKSPPCFYPW
jgi:hypothetical protein